MLSAGFGEGSLGGERENGAGQLRSDQDPSVLRTHEGFGLWITMLVLALGLGRSEVGRQAFRGTSPMRGLGLGPENGCDLERTMWKWPYVFSLERGFLGDGCGQVAGWKVLANGHPVWAWAR